jgi:hypothetical protein
MGARYEHVDRRHYEQGEDGADRHPGDEHETDAEALELRRKNE